MQDSGSNQLSRYLFRDCCVDLRTRELSRSGQQVAIEPKAFELLVYLIENRDRAVDKHELQDNIWTGTVVTEAALTRCLMKVRRAVGDDSRQQKVIKTIHRHGYRFMAPLQQTAEQSAVAPASPKIRNLGPAQTQAESASIAVLPFGDLSPKQDQQYFCDGMAEELMNRLSRIDGVKVAGRSTSFRFRDSDRDVSAIGEQLGVRMLLEGSAQKQETQLRVRLQLVDTRTGYQLWSRKFENTVDDVFAIQDTIAEQVAESLKPQLSPTERESMRPAPPREFRAFDYYLRGLQYFHRFTERDFLLAIEMFDKAIVADPAYTAARAGVANSHAFLYQWFDASADRLRAAKEASAAAVAVDPGSAEAHMACGVAESLDRNYMEAGQSFEKAIELNPNLYEAYYFYARTCTAQGKHARAAELFESAAALRHDEFQCRYLAAQSYMALGLTGHMKTWAQRTLDVVEPLLALNPDDNRALYLGSGAWSMLGNEAKARAYTKQSLAMRPDDPVTIFSAACHYAKLGETENALQLLEGMSAGGFLSRDWLEHDPTLDTLRDEPRFKAVLQRFQ